MSVLGDQFLYLGDQFLYGGVNFFSGESSSVLGNQFLSWGINFCTGGSISVLENQFLNWTLILSSHPLILAGDLGLGPKVPQSLSKFTKSRDWEKDWCFVWE